MSIFYWENYKILYLSFKAIIIIKAINVIFIIRYNIENKRENKKYLWWNF